VYWHPSEKKFKKSADFGSFPLPKDLVNVQVLVCPHIHGTCSSNKLRRCNVFSALYLKGQ
jgi:hypothetical protein